MSSYQISSGSASASASASVPSSRFGFSSASLSAAQASSYALASSSVSASLSASAVGSSSASLARSSRASSARGSSNNQSEIEKQIINSTRPIEINETEEIEAVGFRGIFANKAELENWRGKLPLAEYKIHEDPNPQVIRKASEKVKYIQDIKIRYLKPPPPGAPGDLIIKQQPDVPSTPAPPLVIRKPVEAPKTPEPLIVREAPPCPPPPIPSKTIVVPGKKIPPPPRKVVIEKLADIPPKPQSIIIERWLPYEEPAKRKVVWEKPCPVKPAGPPKNVIIEWQKPVVEIEKIEKNLGVVDADPAEYRRRYQFTKQRTDLPEAVRSLQFNTAPPKRQPKLPELEGDVVALKLVDLDKEGLGEYRSIVSQITEDPETASPQNPPSCGGCSAPAPEPAPCGCNY